jgi:hypothetical protein
MLRADRIAIDAMRAEFSVERVQVEAMRAGNQRQGLGRVEPELVGRARLAGIVARRGNPSAELTIRVFEARYIVSLPAMERDGDVRELPERSLGIDVQVGVLLFRDRVGGGNGLIGHGQPRG